MTIATMLYSDTDTFQTDVLAAYETDGLLLIRQFPLHDREALLKVMSFFGTLQKEHYGSDYDYYHVLKAQESPLLDRIGHIITSSTNHEFGLHTDNYKQILNAKTIGLLCVVPAQVGGDSFTVHLDTMLDELPMGIVAAMKASNWPHTTGPISLLQTHGKELLIRYNRDTIQAIAEAGGIELTERQNEVMNAIDAAANAVKDTLRLERQDMLIMDNQRYLHGRSAFEPNSAREFIRWRINETG